MWYQITYQGNFFVAQRKCRVFCTLPSGVKSRYCNVNICVILLLYPTLSVTEGTQVTQKLGVKNSVTCVTCDPVIHAVPAETLVFPD